MGRTWHSSSYEDKCLLDLYNPASTYQFAYYDKTQSFLSSLQALAQHPCNTEKNLWMIACRCFSIVAVNMHNSLVLWEELKELEVFSALLHCCIQSWRNFVNQSRLSPACCNYVIGWKTRRTVEVSDKWVFRDYQTIHTGKTGKALSIR